MTNTNHTSLNLAISPDEPQLSIEEILEAARVPVSLQPQSFGNWRIDRFHLPERNRFGLPWNEYTILRHAIYPKVDYSNMHLVDDDGCLLDIVMEDSPRELRRHLPIWLNAHGRVLKTGLGLGCVVRGLLSIPAVAHIDVVELDADIIRVIGKEFLRNPRVSIHHGDALSYQFPSATRWDFAWHDIWTEQNEGLQVQHMDLIKRFHRQVSVQGAWQFPRLVKRLAANYGLRLIG
jgi:hypothetical protein